MENKYTKKFQNASAYHIKPSAKSTLPYPYYLKNNSSIITMVILTHMFVCYFFHCTSSVSLRKCNLIFYSKEHEMPWRVQNLIVTGASICHSSPSLPTNLQITDARGRHTINPPCVVCVYNVLFSVTLTRVKCLCLFANA